MLTLLLLFNSLGYVVFYQQVRYQIKSVMRAEIKKGMNSERIEKIIIYEKDIAENKIRFKLVEAHEFRLNGKMYDIVKKIEEPGRVIYYCIHDTKEDALDELFSCLIESGSAPDKTQPAQTVLKLLIKEGITPSDFLPRGYYSAGEYSILLPLNLLAGITPAPFHPPDYLLS